MIRYCTNCWSSVNESVKICPFCGENLKVQQERPDFIDKHIKALRDSDAATQVRAALVLGELRERRAVEALIRLVQKSQDHYAIETAVEALGKIGDWNAYDILQIASTSSSPRVRDKALEALRRLQRGPDIHQP